MSKVKNRGVDYMDKKTPQNNEEIISQIVSLQERQAAKGNARLSYLPDRDEITEIITLLRRLIFPGYFDENEADPQNLSYEAGSLVAQVRHKLSRQICRALNLSGEEDCAGRFAGAGEICDAFLRKLPAVIELLFTDVQAAYDGDPAAVSEHEIIFAYPGIFAISVYRIAHELHLLSVPLIPRMMTEYAHSLTGIDIHPGAEIGHHFFIDHGTGIVVGETTRIGAYAKLYQGVTLGALSTRGGQSLRGKRRHPTLGDEVTVYSGASILGGETTIGSGCVIGGNVFLTKSVPPNTRVNMKNHEVAYDRL